MTKGLEYNKHHTVWCDKWYKTPIEKEFRTHSGLVVPMLVPIHNELHANIAPPPKPQREAMLGAIAMLDDLSDKQISDYLGTVERVADYMTKRDQELGRCLLRRLPYLEEGLYLPKV